MRGLVCLMKLLLWWGVSSPVGVGWFSVAAPRRSGRSCCRCPVRAGEGSGGVIVTVTHNKSSVGVGRPRP